KLYQGEHSRACANSLILHYVAPEFSGLLGFLDADVHPMLIRDVRVVMALTRPVFGQPVTHPQRSASQPIYRVTIVQRTTPAINYGHRSEPTKIDFRGTALLPQAHGDATIENRRGATPTDARLSSVPPPTRFGAEYLT